MNAMLSDRLALAQRKRFGSSSENMRKVMNRWICSTRQKHRRTRRQRNRLLKKSNPSSYKRKKHTEKKEEDLSDFEVFAKSIRGADASAVVYSITETALLNGLKPYVYLTYVLDQIRQMRPFPKPKELDRLLPWSDNLPEGFRTKNKG